jgi:N-alpha-acetyltransferase 30
MEENKIKLEDLTWRTFESEADLSMIMKMMTRDLSEPYPIYTYRFFVQQWPELTLLAYHKDKCLGCIVSKLDVHKKNKIGETSMRKRGYIAMLSVEPEFRKIGLGRLLVKKSIDLMVEQGADEILIETEVTN